MATNQLAAVSKRRRLTTSQVPSVLAQANILPQLYAEKQRQGEFEQMADIQKQRNVLAEQDLAFQQQAIEQGQQSAKTATGIAGATLGVQAAMMAPQLKALGQTTPTPSAAGIEATGAGVPAGETSFTTNALSAFKTPGTYYGGAAGGLAGASIAKAVSDEPWWRILGGALGGGAGSYLATGDLYSAAIGGVLGGVLGGII